MSSRRRRRGSSRRGAAQRSTRALLSRPGRRPRPQLIAPTAAARRSDARRSRAAPRNARYRLGAPLRARALAGALELPGLAGRRHRIPHGAPPRWDRSRASLVAGYTARRPEQRLRVFDLFTPSERADWSAAGPEAGGLPRLQQTVARLVRSGGRVAIGSDAPAVPYGLGVHYELALIAAAGIPNDQVLRLATAEGALALGSSGSSALWRTASWPTSW